MSLTGQSQLLSGVQVVLLDIEGTTTPIAYVKDKVFPFIRENVQRYLETRFDEKETQDDIEAIRQNHDSSAQESGDEAGGGVGLGREAIINATLHTVYALMDADSKVTALKSLQGHVWRVSVEGGQKIVGEDFYEDVVRALKQWSVGGQLRVYIYSSGSVEAQRLLFGHSPHGDLMPYLSGYYDTCVGTKREASSYERIAVETKTSPDNILFLTDIPEEAIAARTAGLRTALVVREGNAPLSEDNKALFPVIHSFDQLFTPATS